MKRIIMQFSAVIILIFLLCLQIFALNSFGQTSRAAGDSAGKASWRKIVCSNGVDSSEGIAVDGSGNIYIAGVTSGDLDGNKNAGARDAFISKFDITGARLWTRLLGSAMDDCANGVALDASGNVYVTGWTAGNLDGKEHSGGYDAFISKYNPAGEKQWVTLLGTEKSDLGLCIKIDPTGSIYIAGSTSGNLSGNANSGCYDAFIARYDQSGAKKWLRLLGSTALDSAGAVAIDGSGNIYITGTTNGDLGGNKNSGSFDAFIASYDSSGEMRWVKHLGSAALDSAEGIALDKRGNIYITGYSNGNPLDGYLNAGSTVAFIAKYDPFGVKQWVQVLDSKGHDYAGGIAIGESGDIYITGFTNGDLDGNKNAGHYDAFVVKYDATGAKHWSRLLGSKQSTKAVDIAIGPSGCLFITGYTSGNTMRKISSGINDAFIAGMSPDEIPRAGEKSPVRALHGTIAAQLLDILSRRDYEPLINVIAGSRG